MATNPSSAVASALCSAHRLGLVSFLSARLPSTGCRTPAGTPTAPPEPAQLICGPTSAGINDECPDWATTPLPDATIADRTNTAIIQSALPGDGLDATAPSVLSPNGATLYTVGTCTGGPCGPIGGVYGAWFNVDGVEPTPPPGDHGIVTAAYDAYSGALEWTRTYDSGSRYENATAVTASKTSVFTLAEHFGDAWWPTGTYESHLLAYRHDGAPLWRTSLSQQLAQSEALDDAARTLFVGGTRVQQLSSGQCRIDAVVTAFSSLTGARKWQASLPGNAGKCTSQSGTPVGSMNGGTVAISGGLVYMTGVRTGTDGFGKTIVLAGFDAHTGRQVSHTEYTPPVPRNQAPILDTSGPPVCDLNGDAPVLASPDGRRVFVNMAEECPQGASYYIWSLTLAFDARNGSLIWHATDTGGAANDNYPWLDHPMTLSPDGQDVVVAGASSTASNSSLEDGFVTTAYRVTSGRQVWTTRYVYPIHAHQTMCVFCGPSVAHTAHAIVVSGYMNGGYNEGIPYAQYAPNATVGFDPNTGEQLWVAFDQPFDRTSAAVIGNDLLANPKTRAVYAITGTSQVDSNIAIRVLGYHAAN